MNRIKVFACEPQPIIVEGLARALEQNTDFELAGSTSGLNEALDAVREHHPDVLLVDQTPGLKAVFQFLADVKSTWPQCQPVVWVSDLAEIDCFRALQLGARGILKKTAAISVLIECLRAVNKGDVWIESSLAEHPMSSLDRRNSPRLTPREREIVHHICVGLKNKEIGEALSITPGTVKVHLMHIFEKTGVKDRFELAVHGRRMLGLDRASDGARIERASVTEGTLA